MPGLLTEITEITTALGTLGGDLDGSLRRRPHALCNVPDATWARIVTAHEGGEHVGSFQAAFENGAEFLAARDGLRGRRPVLVEWRGPNRPPGDDAIPADLRIDHVYLVSCKYLSRVLVNSGPTRLFDRLLAGEGRSGAHWFLSTAPDEYRAFYALAREAVGGAGLPSDPSRLTVEDQRLLRAALAARSLPEGLQPAWSALCGEVARVSAERWRAALTGPRERLHLLWRLLRVSNATYFVLGADKGAHLRLRVSSTWDWNHRFDLRSLAVAARPAGQPEVAWRAEVRDRASGEVREIAGHVEVRWSHGRFVGTPEAKVYLDTLHAGVPGYEPLGPAAPRRRAAGGAVDPSQAPLWSAGEPGEPGGAGGLPPAPRRARTGDG